MRGQSALRFWATRGGWLIIFLYIYTKALSLSRNYKKHYIVVIKKVRIWACWGADNLIIRFPKVPLRPACTLLRCGKCRASKSLYHLMSAGLHYLYKYLSAILGYECSGNFSNALPRQNLGKQFLVLR